MNIISKIDSKKVYLVTSNAESGTLESLPADTKIETIDLDWLLQSNLHFTKDDKVCIASEAAIELVTSRIVDPGKQQAVRLLKDKYAFRQMLGNLYPQYQYQLVKSADIQELKIDRKSIIKPVKGVFGTAVRTIDQDTDLTNLSGELQSELLKNKSIFSDSVLSQEDFLVEQYIEGEEYAVDMFYNSSGDPCITNIYHHPIPANLAYLHVIYYSSKLVFDRIYTKAKVFFTALNKILNVTNITIHGEFKLDGEELVPIELNSLRCGGMGLGNLIFHSLGVNPYLYFLNEIEPDWQQLWHGKDQDLFTFFIAYNGKNIDLTTHNPNYQLLEQQFTEILFKQYFDYQSQLAFGIYFLKETNQNLSLLLEIEFDNFFKKNC
jgi:ATP-grasp domain